LTQEQFAVPSFRTKDLDDAYYFIGRLKSQQVEEAERTTQAGETFTSVQLHVIFEQLDREVPSVRHGFMRIPRGVISPTSPLGRYIVAMDSAGTPFDFTGGGTTAELNEAVQAQVDTVYVCVNRSLGTSRNQDTPPARYVFPIAKIGYGNEWSAEDGARIISDARAVSAAGATAQGKTVAKVSATAAAPAATLPKLNDPMTGQIASSLVAAVAGSIIPEATTKALAWVQEHKDEIAEPSVLMIQLSKGMAFWQELAQMGYCSIDNGHVIAA